MWIKRNFPITSVYTYNKTINLHWLQPELGSDTKLGNLVTMASAFMVVFEGKTNNKIWSRPSENCGLVWKLPRRTALSWITSGRTCRSLETSVHHGKPPSASNGRCHRTEKCYGITPTNQYWNRKSWISTCQLNLLRTNINNRVINGATVNSRHTHWARLCARHC